MAVQKLAGLKSDTFRHRHLLAFDFIKVSQLITKLEKVLIAAKELRCIEILFIERFNADKDFQLRTFVFYAKQQRRDKNSKNLIRKIHI